MYKNLTIVFVHFIILFFCFIWNVSEYKILHYIYIAKLFHHRRYCMSKKSRPSILYVYDWSRLLGHTLLLYTTALFKLPQLCIWAPLPVFSPGAGSYRHIQQCKLIKLQSTMKILTLFCMQLLISFSIPEEMLKWGLGGTWAWATSTPC